MPTSDRPEPEKWTETGTEPKLDYKKWAETGTEKWPEPKPEQEPKPEPKITKKAYKFSFKLNTVNKYLTKRGESKHSIKVKKRNASDMS